MKSKEKRVDTFLAKQFDDEKNLKLMLVKVDHHLYIFYGKYIIRDNLEGCSVEVDSRKLTFGTIKTALTWCTYQEKRLITDCKNIEFIDAKLSALDIDITQHTSILRKSTDNETIEIYNTKLSEDYYVKKILHKRLTKYINTAKVWQSKMFDKAKLLSKKINT